MLGNPPWSAALEVTASNYFALFTLKTRSAAVILAFKITVKHNVTLIFATKPHQKKLQVQAAAQMNFRINNFP